MESLLNDVLSAVLIIHILWPPAQRHIGYLINIEDNVNTLIRATEALTSKCKDLQEANEGSSWQVQNWIKEVARIEEEVTLIKAEFHQRRTIFNGRFTNYWSRYQLGKRVLKKLKEVKDVNDERVFDHAFVSPQRPTVVEMGTTSVHGQSRSEQTMGIMMEADTNVIETLTKMEAGELFCEMAGYGVQPNPRSLAEDVAKECSDCQGKRGIYNLALWLETLRTKRLSTCFVQLGVEERKPP